MKIYLFKIQRRIHNILRRSSSLSIDQCWHWFLKKNVAIRAFHLLYFNHKAGYIWTHQFTLNWHYKNTSASFYDWIMLNTKLPTCKNAEKLPEVPIYNQIVRSFHGYFNITFCSLKFYFHFIFFMSELILRILNSSCVFYEEITQGHNVIFDLLTNDLSCTIKKV